MLYWFTSYAIESIDFFYIELEKKKLHILQDKDLKKIDLQVDQIFIMFKGGTYSFNIILFHAEEKKFDMKRNQSQLFLEKKYLTWIFENGNRSNLHFFFWQNS